MAKHKMLSHDSFSDGALAYALVGDTAENTSLPSTASDTSPALRPMNPRLVMCVAAPWEALLANLSKV